MRSRKNPKRSGRIAAPSSSHPSAEESANEFAAALEELAAGPLPPAEPAMAALLARQRLAIELQRGQAGELAGARDAAAQLEAVRDERAYKMASAVRRRLGR